MGISDVRSPDDLKKLSLSELESYAEDLRQKILTTSMANGGHLGASLGAVEIAIAVHYVFHSPQDSIVWDVGHQAYAHKLITGRAEQFSTLRKYKGLSGFLSREESSHDVFGAGHSSTSLSVALALAWSNQRAEKSQDKKNWSIAVIGDGAITAGIAFEALNNVRAKPIGPMLVVLNDNQMSISANVGAVPTILSGANAREFFGLFGFDYIGPTDGHDLGSLIGQLQAIRSSDSGNPIVLHVLTQKGKGYAPAEENPERFHGVSPLQEKVLDRPAPPKQQSFSDAFGKAICKLAEEDPKVVAITAAMPEGTGLTEFSRKFPDRFFDVGIAEPHAVTFAAGLATRGYKPIVAIYSTFMQRALDSIIHDVALQRLGVTFALDRAGLVGADGPTHHGVFDLAYMGMIPEMEIYAPAILEDVEIALRRALKHKGPSVIRYPRGSATPTRAPLTGSLRWHLKVENPRIIVVALGASFQRVEQAIAGLENLSVISLIQAKPIPVELTEYLNENSETHLLVVEDGVVAEGFGARLLAELAPRSKKAELRGYGDHFVAHGTPAQLEEDEQVSSAALKKLISGLK